MIRVRRRLHGTRLKATKPRRLQGSASYGPYKRLMTKAELIRALADLPEDAEIMIEAWPDTGQQRADLAALPRHGELYPIYEVEAMPADEGNAAFLTLKPDTKLKP
jgi:hypothetical protein